MQFWSCILSWIEQIRLPQKWPVRDAERRKPCGRFVRLHRPRFAMSRHRIVRAFVRWHTEASQLSTYPLFLRSSTHTLDEIQNVCRLRLPHGTRDPWQRLVARDRPGCQHRSFADRGFNAITDPEWFARGFIPPVPISRRRVSFPMRCGPSLSGLHDAERFDGDFADPAVPCAPNRAN
jgi:hypothetical protein